MNLLKKSIVAILVIIFGVISIRAVNAVGIWTKIEENMKKTGGEAGYSQEARDMPLPTIIANVIKIILSFIGAVYLFMIIIAGWQWLFSGGNEEKTGAAMKRITHSTIGLIIVLAAYLLTDFITTVFIAATGVGGN